MLKLILVDDEADVREGLMQQIDWEDGGFMVEGCAENGREALEMIERCRPDVVVTDIHMPFMDGLQLSQWIRDNYPLTKIIILTGYDEFEYARKAIRLQIDEYVLKPFSSGELAGILGKVKERIERETAEKEDLEQLRDHYRSSLPVLRELFLAELAVRRIPSKVIEEKQLSLEVDLSQGHYAGAVLSLDVPVRQSRPGEDNAAGNRKEPEERSLQLLAVRRMVEELLAETPDIYVFMAGGEIGLIACRLQEELPRKLLRLLELIRDKVRMYLKLSVSIGVGASVAEACGLYRSFEDARQALDYRLLLGEGRVIWIHDVEAADSGTRHLSMDILTEERLIRAIKLGTPEERGCLIDSLFNPKESGGASMLDYQVFWLEMMAVLLRLAKESGMQPQELFGPESNPLTEFAAFTGPDPLKERLTDICGKLASKFENGRSTSRRSVVEQAKLMVQQQYGNSELTIGEVCSRLHISSGYFSTIFKKETGLTFVTYLMQIRMEAARELLRTTGLKAFEIAEQTGFSDPNYFSFCFKKKFGLSPKEYRASESG